MARRLCDVTCGLAGVDRLERLPDAGAAVAILEPDHIIQLRSGNLEDVAILERDHAMALARRDVMGLARLQRNGLELALLVVKNEVHLSRIEEDRFHFLPMILQRQLVALLDVQDLADVVGGMGPDQLMAPGLLHARDVLLGHTTCPPPYGPGPEAAARFS